MTATRVLPRRPSAVRGLELVVVATLVGCGSTAPAPAPPSPAPTTPDAAPAAPTTRAGCDGARLPRPPAPSDDLATRVGVRTVTAGELTVEVWYPARPTAPAPTRYDLRAAMPTAVAAAIPDAAEPWLTCPCTRDAAVDVDAGPYPIVVFLHGAASFRAQSARLAARWAAHGFVVIAPDLPGAGLRAALGEGGGLPFTTPAAALDLALTASADDPLEFIRPQLGRRAAVIGHSLGAMLANSLAERPEVDLVIGLAPGLIAPDGEPRLIVAGDRDAITSVARLRATHGTLTNAELVVVPGADHLSFSDLCEAGAAHGGPLAAARHFGVAVPEALIALVADACVGPDATGAAIADVTSAALDRALACAAEASVAAVATARGLEFHPAR